MDGNKDIIKIEKNPDGSSIITPRNVLRDKMGYGGVNTMLMDRAQEMISQSAVEFEPYAQEFLKCMITQAGHARSQQVRNNETLQSLIRPVMELKANGGMYKYQMITSIADIMLGFLEHLDHLSDEAIDIVELHYKAMLAIILNKMVGDGGKEGQILLSELSSACSRYNRKHRGLPPV